MEILSVLFAAVFKDMTNSICMFKRLRMYFPHYYSRDSLWGAACDNENYKLYIGRNDLF